MTKRGNSANYALEPNQVPKVMGACVNLEERIIVGCPLYLGLRASETTHLRRSWISPDGNIKIPWRQECDCTDCSRRGREWRPKTKAAIRTLPITRPIKKDLLHFLEIQPKGLHISRVTFNIKTKAILKRAGIRFDGLAQHTAFPHALRATCATMLAAGGMDAVALCFFMGWASLKVGQQYVQMAQATDLALKQGKQIFGG